jgi:hypothetical protein
MKILLARERRLPTCDIRDLPKFGKSRSRMAILLFAIRHFVCFFEREAVFVR